MKAKESWRPRDNTPVEYHWMGDDIIMVKRDDLCAPKPAPALSKLRGVWRHLERSDKPIIGCLDSAHSKNGWTVAAACEALGKQAIIFWPKRKAMDADYVPEFQQNAGKLGAIIIPLPARRAAILQHKARNMMGEMCGEKRWELLPNGLKTLDSVEANALEMSNTVSILPERGTLLIPVGTATMAAGLLLGLERERVLRDWDVLLHLGYTRSHEAVIRHIEEMTGCEMRHSLGIIDEGFKYSDSCDLVDPPFPMCPYYEAKAWKWLMDPAHRESLLKPIVFWNMGD